MFAIHLRLVLSNFDVVVLSPSAFASLFLSISLSLTLTRSIFVMYIFLCVSSCLAFVDISFGLYQIYQYSPLFFLSSPPPLSHSLSFSLRLFALYDINCFEVHMILYPKITRQTQIAQQKSKLNIFHIKNDFDLNLPVLAFENTVVEMWSDSVDGIHIIERYNPSIHVEYYAIECNFHIRVNFVLLRTLTPCSYSNC